MGTISQVILRQTRFKLITTSVPTYVFEAAMTHLALTPSPVTLQSASWVTHAAAELCNRRPASPASRHCPFGVRTTQFNSNVAALTTFPNLFSLCPLLQELTLDFTLPAPDTSHLRFLAAIYRFTALLVTYRNLEYMFRGQRGPGAAITGNFLTKLTV